MTVFRKRKAAFFLFISKFFRRRAGNSVSDPIRILRRFYDTCGFAAVSRPPSHIKTFPAFSGCKPEAKLKKLKTLENRA